WVGPIPRFSFGPLQLDLSKLGVSPLHILAIPQRRLERLLDERVRDLGGAVRRGHELTALSQDDEGVTLDIAGPGGRLPIAHPLPCGLRRRPQLCPQASRYRLSGRDLVGALAEVAAV